MIESGVNPEALAVRFDRLRCEELIESFCFDRPSFRSSEERARHLMRRRMLVVEDDGVLRGLHTLRTADYYVQW